MLHNDTSCILDTKLPCGITKSYAFLHSTQ